MIEFYLILAAVRKVPSSIFWKLLIGSLVMLIGGYLGEAGYIQPFVGFIIGMAGWITYYSKSSQVRREAAAKVETDL